MVLLEFAVLVPLLVLCQYQVTSAGGVLPNAQASVTTPFVLLCTIGLGGVGAGTYNTFTYNVT